MNEGHLTFLASPEWARMLETDLLPWLEGEVDLGDDVLEVGPGPGLTTDLLRERTARLTAVEVDPSLAEALTARLSGTGVEVIHGDASSTNLPSDRFSAATCFSMLHHVPGPDLQDRIFSELCRVLRPGGVFVGVDSRDLDAIRAGHIGDVFVPVDPDTFAARLEAAGFSNVTIEIGDYQIRFTARKPTDLRQKSADRASENAVLAQEQASSDRSLSQRAHPVP
jgi:SAM-dependent methyltransferase